MLAFICAAADPPSDREFITWIYTEFSRLMFHTAGRYAAAPQEQEDIVQDCFVRLIGKTALLRPMTRPVLAAYLVATVRNASINHLRAQQAERQRRAELEEADRRSGLPPLPAEELLLLRERSAQLAAIWPRLTEEEQFLLEGRYMLDLKDAELAEQLGCQADSVRMKLTRARRRALRLLAEQEAR